MELFGAAVGAFVGWFGSSREDGEEVVGYESGYDHENKVEEEAEEEQVEEREEPMPPLRVLAVNSMYANNMYGTLDPRQVKSWKDCLNEATPKDESPDEVKQCALGWARVPGLEKTRLFMTDYLMRKWQRLFVCIGDERGFAWLEHTLRALITKSVNSKDKSPFGGVLELARAGLVMNRVPNRPMFTEPVREYYPEFQLGFYGDGEPPKWLGVEFDVGVSEDDAKEYLENTLLPHLVAWTSMMAGLRFVSEAQAQRIKTEAQNARKCIAARNNTLEKKLAILETFLVMAEMVEVLKTLHHPVLPRHVY